MTSPLLIQRIHLFPLHMGCKIVLSDSSHDTMMLDDLVKYLEGQINGLRKEAYGLDTALSEMYKYPR